MKHPSSFIAIYCLSNIAARRVVTVLGISMALFSLGAEANETHVWNLLIEAHARLHIVWQLASNTLQVILAILILWFGNPCSSGRADFRSRLTFAIILLLVEPLGFLFAAATRQSYNGAYFSVNVPQYNITIMGVPLALAFFSGMSAILLSILLLHRAPQSESTLPRV